MGRLTTISWGRVSARRHASWVVAIALACLLPPPARAQVDPRSQPAPLPPGAAEPASPPAPVTSPWSVTWTAALGGFAQAPAATDHASVYVPLRTGTLVAVAIDSGAVRWTTTARTDVGIAASTGSVYVAAADAIESLSAGTGERAWRVPLPARPAAAPIAWGALVIAVLESGDVRALDRATGAAAWEQALGGAPSLVSGVSSGRFLVALSDGQVAMLEAASGRLLWRQQVPAAVSALRADADRAYVGARDNFLYALDGRDGRIRWRWRTGGDVVGVPDVDARRVYFVSLDNVVRALDRLNGAQRWKRGLPTRPLGGPLLLGEELIVAGVSAALHVTGVSTGTARPIVGLGAEPSWPALAVAPSAGDGGGPSLLVVTRDGRLHRLTRGPDGPPASDPALPSPPVPPPVPPVLP